MSFISEVSGPEVGVQCGWLLGPKYHQAKTGVLSGPYSHLETSDSHLPPHASLCLAEFWSWPRWDRRAIPLLAGCRELPLAHRCHPVLCHLLFFILRVSVRASNLTQSLQTSHLLEPEERRLFEGLMVSLTQHDLFLRAKLPSDSQCRGVLPRMGLHSNFCLLLNYVFLGWPQHSIFKASALPHNSHPFIVLGTRSLTIVTYWGPHSSMVGNPPLSFPDFAWFVDHQWNA